MAADQETAVEELKWWIDRGPAKEREQTGPSKKGIIEEWAFELLKDYRQERALQSIVDINQQIVKKVAVEPQQWAHVSLGVGEFPRKKLDQIKGMLRIPRYARAVVVDAGYSVRVLVTGEPPGEKIVDLNLSDQPSLDFWVNNELIQERLFGSFDEALKRLRHSLHRYLKTTVSDWR